MSLPEALERAAGALPEDARAIRPANGDPHQLLEALSAEAAARVLCWLLAEETGAAEELATAWCEHETGRAVLASIEEAGLAKVGRKALRRIRHRLRSRGENLPEAAPATPVVARLPDLGDQLDLAFVSGVDPRGAQAVYLVESSPGGGARLFEILLDPERGVLDFELYHAGRSKVRQFLKALTQRPRVAVCAAEPSAARALVGRIAGTHPAKRPFPDHFAEWRARIVGECAGRPTPGDEAVAALDGEIKPALLHRAVEQVRSGMVGPWPPSREVLTRLAERVKEGAESGLVLTAAQRQERIARLIDEEAGVVFQGAFAEWTAARWRELAYVAWKSGREEDARAAVAAAAAFTRESPAGNPVAAALLEAALAPVIGELLRSETRSSEGSATASESEEGGEDAGATASESLIIKP